jgi:hypothetical protein
MQSVVATPHTERKTTVLNHAEILKLRKSKEESRRWIESNLCVQSKEGGLVAMKMTASQEALFNAIWDQIMAGEPVRIISVKPRQIRHTSLVQAVLFHALYMKSNRNSLVIANSEDVAKNVQSTFYRFYRNLSDDLRESRKLNSKSRTYIEYSHPHSSRQIVTTAKKGDVGGKSFTFQYIHGTECADWYTVCDADLLWASVLASMPSSEEAARGTAIILESTSSGQDPFFYPKAKAAFAGNMPGWRCLFIPWFDEPEYKSRVPEGFKLTMAEKVYHDKYPHLTHEQMAWRRKKIEEDCSNNERLFKRYYPSSFNEAFEASSQSLFSQAVCERKRTDAEEYTDFERGDFTLADNRKIGTWRLTNAGRWFLWEKPEPGEKYTIGADPSQYDRNSDACAAYIIKNSELRVVGAFHGSRENHKFAQDLSAAGFIYNTALLVPENNIPSLAMELNVHCQYPNIYTYATGLDNYGNRPYTNPSRTVFRYGLNMNTSSRAAAIEKLMAVYENYLICPDPGFWLELSHFKAKEYIRTTTNHRKQTIKEEIRSKFEGEKGFGDDRIMAMCCTLWPLSRKDMRSRIHKFESKKAIESSENKTQAEVQAANDGKWSRVLEIRRKRMESGWFVPIDIQPPERVKEVSFGSGVCV